MREMQKRTSKDEDVYSYVCIKKNSMYRFQGAFSLFEFL